MAGGGLSLEGGRSVCGRVVGRCEREGRERRRRGGGGVGTSLVLGGLRGPGDSVCEDTSTREAAMVEASSPPLRLVERAANEEFPEKPAVTTAAVLAREISRGGSAGGRAGREEVEALGA